MNKLLQLLMGVVFSCHVLAQGGQPLKVTEVAPGLFVHFGRHQLPDKTNHGAIANIGFIVGERCVAVIDTGGNPAEGAALKQAITAITTKPVCYVINTHVHPDHVFGNSAFRQEGVTFIGHRNLPRALSMRAPFYLERSEQQLGVVLTEKDVVLPDRVVGNHLRLDLGGRILRLQAYPTAHTDNDLSVYDEKTDTLWLSDLLFIEHIPVIDGSIRGWIKVMQRLQNEHYTRVIPGHGPLVSDWPRGMLPELAYLTTVLDETRAAVKQGIYLEDAVSKVGLSEQDNWLLFADFHKKNVTSAYAELEWED